MTCSITKKAASLATAFIALGAFVLGPQPATADSPGACTGSGNQILSTPSSIAAQSGDAGGTGEAQPPSAVTPASSSGHGRLAFTGASVSEPILLAIASIGLGALLVVSARRKRKRHPGAGVGLIGVGLVAVATLHDTPRVLTDTGCLPSPMLPESPSTVLLPIAGILALAIVLVLKRPRKSGHTG